MVFRIIRYTLGGMFCMAGAGIGNIVVILIGAAFLIVPTLIRFMKARNLQPSGMRCPNCGADDVKISGRMEGVAASSDIAYERSFVFPNHRSKVRGQSGAQIMRQRVARCQKCGFDYPYLTAREVRNEQTESKYSLIIVSAVIVALMVIGVVLEHSPKQTDDTGETKSEVNSVWTAEHTPLDDFKYYIDGNEITLTDYNGRDKKINIAPVYELEGKEYRVVSLDGTFSLGSVTSVIVPEGVISIADNTFNSTGIKFLYLPSTLEKFNGWSYFHDTQKLYYGGTEEQWSALYTRDRSSIDVVQIICAANVSDLIS